LNTAMKKTTNGLNPDKIYRIYIPQTLKLKRPSIKYLKLS